MKDKVGAMGDLQFTTTRASHGNNRRFHIFGRKHATYEGSLDCENIDRLVEGNEPPTNGPAFAAINTAADSLPNQEGTVVVLNCKHGQMRSPTMAGIYMIRRLNMSLADAMAELSDAFGITWGNAKDRTANFLAAYVQHVVGQPAQLAAGVAGGEREVKRRSLRLSGKGTHQ
jgi:hypothetical protein